MSLSRRKFLFQSSIASTLLLDFTKKLESLQFTTADDNEINWKAVRAEFPIAQWDKIHFNSGSAGVMPTIVQDYVIQLIKAMNRQAPYEAWGDWQEIKRDNLMRLRGIINAENGSIEIVRNTTEALNMIIYGLQLDEGDEVIISNNDYPFAHNAWHNRRERDHISLQSVAITLPQDEDTIVEAYKRAISPRTKIIHLTHITHREGHIMPVDKICALAHQSGIKVVVDGAHSFGLLHFDIQSMGADYYATSLHKWLNAPHGTGLIYVRPELISGLSNHPSSYPSAQGSISKFEHIGTRAFHQEIGISAALDFFDSIPFTAKIKRLQSLKEYWSGQLKNIDTVNFHTHIDSQYSAAIATISIDGISGGRLVKILDQEYDIHIKSVSGSWGSGIRMSVNIFTSLGELDKFVAAIKTIAA